jgi:hypothetical protein
MEVTFQEKGNLCTCTEFLKLYVYLDITKSSNILLLVLLKYKLYQHFLPHPVAYTFVSRR